MTSNAQLGKKIQETKADLHCDGLGNMLVFFDINYHPKAINWENWHELWLISWDS